MTTEVIIQGLIWIVFGVLLALALTFKHKPKQITINKRKEHEEYQEQ